MGTNEVPKAHGGQYWDGDANDGRDWSRGFDSNDRAKRANMGELLQVLSDNKLLSKQLTSLPIVTGHGFSPLHKQDFSN